MRDTTRKRSSSRAAALRRSGKGNRAVKLASCAWLLAADAGAHLFSLYGLAADAAGNLHILDRDSRHIREADSSRVITAISGAGKHRFGVGCGQSHAACCGADQ